jgi:hypothetical protein
MSNQLLAILKNKLESLSAYGSIDPETTRNVLKEELQFYVLNFIYHHREYGNWIMYGGSALRIIHGLDRMSVDLDFEVAHPIDEKFLGGLKNEFEAYFSNTYGIDADFLTIGIINGRGLVLKFHIGKDLDLGYHSIQVHLKIDLNHFVAPKTATERRPINHGQLSFVILTYTMSTLMSSKIAAIFLRGERGVGKAVYNEKGRDIYDLLWYMGKKIVSDPDYLIAKGIDAKDQRAIFDKLTLKMNEVNDKNLRDDLTPLFLDRNYIENWLKNWQESYLRLFEAYKIKTVKSLEKISIFQDFMSDNFYFHYIYNTEDGSAVRITYAISDYWIEFRDGELFVEADKKLEDKIEFSSSGATSHPASQERLKQYATLFNEKNKKYFKKVNNVILGDSIATKLIRMTADNLNRNEQILLNKAALLSCELDDLLK